MRKILICPILVLLAAVPAIAQQQPVSSSDVYWQQLIAAKEAHSSLQIVTLAQKLDEARRQIVELKKIIDNAKHDGDKK